MAENFANDPSTTLGAAVTTTGQTAWTVASSTGFPATPFRARIGNEIILVTNVAGTGWTVTRNQESTTAATYIVGTPVVHVVTAAALTNFAQKDQANTWSQTQTFAGITATSGSISGQAMVVTNDTRLTPQADATASVRALGTSAQQALPGNHASVTNARTPTAHASTHLSNGADPIAAATTSVGGLLSAADKTKLDSIVTGGVPAGTIVLWGTATPPSGWLILNGQATTGYPNMVTMFGANLPDMRGLFPLGVGTNANFDTPLEAGGTATINVAHIPAHSHSLSNHTHGNTSGGGVDHSHSGYASNTGVNHNHGTGYIDANHWHAEIQHSSNAVFYTGGGTGMDNAIWGGSSTNYGNHTHGSTGWVSSWHDHSVSTGTASAVWHTHPTGTPSNNSTGTDGGSGQDYYQPFRALHFIVKT